MTGAQTHDPRVVAAAAFARKLLPWLLCVLLAVGLLDLATCTLFPGKARHAAVPRATPPAAAVERSSFPASQADLSARWHALDPSAPMITTWLPAPAGDAAEYARLGFPPRFHAALPHGQTLSVNRNSDGSLREIMLTVPGRASDDAAIGAIIQFVYALSPNEKVSDANRAAAAVNDAREQGSIVPQPVGGNWIGVFPAFVPGGAFQVWAVPNGEEELTIGALNKELQKDDDRTVAQAAMGQK